MSEVRQRWWQRDSAKHSHSTHVLGTAAIRYPYYPHFGQTLTSAKVFSPRTAPSTGGTSQWSSDSDSGLDAGWDVEQHCINQWVNRGDLGELFRPFVA
jgi:hypothetical protein